MTEKNGWGELLSGTNLSLLTVISSGIGLHAFNQFAVVTALPVAVNEIGGAAFYSWAYSLYFVGSVAGGVTAVLFRERFGARMVPSFRQSPTTSCGSSSVAPCRVWRTG